MVSEMHGAAEPAVLGLALEQGRDLEQLLGARCGRGIEGDQRIFQQLVHVVEVAHGLGPLGGVGDHLGAQAQPRRIGAQVVGNAADQHAPCLQQAEDALAEPVEGGDQGADLGRAAWRVGDALGLFGEGHVVHRLRQIAQGARLPPQHEHDHHGDDEAEHAGPEPRREAEHAEGENAAGGDDQRLARLEGDRDLDRARARPRPAP
jgi:hypothetical protein